MPYAIISKKSEHVCTTTQEGINSLFLVFGEERDAWSWLLRSENSDKCTVQKIGFVEKT